MTAGALRYRRSLGYIGTDPVTAPNASAGVDPAQPGAASNPIESILGFDAYGKKTTDGGKGVFVAMAPTTLLGMILGAMLGGMVKKNASGALVGAMAGAAAATGIRTAAHFGV